MTQQRISPEVIAKDFKNCCTSNAMDETDDNICGMAVKMMGTLGV